MQSIQHLSTEEQKHFILCDCGHYIDMRDLAEVFNHLHTSSALPKAEWSHAVRKGDPAAYPRQGKVIGLN